LTKWGNKASVKSRRPGQLEMERASFTSVVVSYHLLGTPGSLSQAVTSYSNIFWI